MARLLLFQAKDSDDEYVVISEDMPDADNEALEEEHGARECKLVQVVELLDDLSLWPTERPLRAS